MLYPSASPTVLLVIQVLLTDGNEEAVSNCRHNIAFNSGWDHCGTPLALSQGCRDKRIACEVLEWGSRRVEADLVVASDVIYNESVLESLVEQLCTQLRYLPHLCEEDQSTMLRTSEVGLQNPTAVFASAVRNPETLKSFVKRCEAAGLLVREVERVVLDKEGTASCNMQLQWQHCEAFEGGEELVLHYIS